MYFKRVGLIYYKLLSARIVCNRHVALDGSAVILFHYRTVNAASGAGGHFNKAAVNASAFNVAQCGDAVFGAVNGKVGVSGHFPVHCLEYAARSGEEAGAAVIVGVGALFGSDLCLVKPICQLLKGQHRVN